jgi:hypothetical protein
MNKELAKLIPAIVSYVTDRESTVSKTKLLKLIYLFDIEWYRRHHETYTAFDWMYHLLGPWTASYDATLEGLIANEILSVRKGGSHFDAELFETDQEIDLDQLFDNYRDEFLLKGVLNTWGEKSTPEILDHVYFRTEPMRDAVRGDKLDFSTVQEQPIPEYKRTSSGVSKEEIAAARQRIIDRQQQRKQGDKQEFTPPHYDEDYYDFIEKLEAMN